ncbi:MAG: MurT ligase domain-containing protein [Candidatus Dormibacteraeota bacterium]|nr:MurT ligase domain-containing protein [Candidatus Dormibacteraeota bacterium]
MRKAAAVWAGKVTGALSRISRRGGGTTLPGDVARAIDPDVLRKLSSELKFGSVVITGTNGKTTTARLISWLLEGAGHRVVSNRAGANLIFGATAAALDSADVTGRLRADWGVFEIDEASLPKAIAEIKPTAVIVLNLFRDQLDRYGELELIAKKVESALENLPPESHALLNADDPRVAEIGLNLPNQPLWYGLDDTTVAAHELPHAADARTCPRCGTSLIFDAVYVGHDGVYRCPNNDFARPAPEMTATNITLDGFDSIAITVGMTRKYPEGVADTTQPLNAGQLDRNDQADPNDQPDPNDQFDPNDQTNTQRIEIPLGGLYNCYNVLAAYATGVTIGLDPKYIAERLHNFRAAFGRQERMEFRGRNLNLVLSKNPAGFNETLRTAVDLAKGKCFLIGLNDRKADGTDVSWIWDVDFEQLKGKQHAVVPAGNRAHDLAVRFKYAGIEATQPETDPGRALDALVKVTPEGETAHLLCTYTAMLDLRAELVRRGWAKPYWET